MVPKPSLSLGRHMGNFGILYLTVTILGFDVFLWRYHDPPPAETFFFSRYFLSLSAVYLDLLNIFVRDWIFSSLVD